MPTFPAEWTDRDQRALERVLDGLDKAHSRAECQFDRQRKHSRKPYRGQLSIFVPSFNATLPPTGPEGLPVGWSYSLSQGGVGFVSLHSFYVDDVMIGLHMPSGQLRWLTGKIVRRREMPEERYIEYGVAFVTGG